jgi:hypothetical protein
VLFTIINGNCLFLLNFALEEDIKIASIDRCAKDAVPKPQIVNVCPVKIKNIYFFIPPVHVI